MDGKKKKDEAPPKIPLGRPGNTLKMGIVGLPNVGKSSTYNLLSKLAAPAENYMFCTIDPNKAKVEVPDSRFDKLVEIYQPKKSSPASLTIFDIAGLVKGASQGQGMGNAFLSHVQSVDGIYHCVRAFDDEEIQHYEGEVDPIRDLDIIQSELMEKDKTIISKGLEDLTKVIGRTNNKEAKEEKDVLDKVVDLYNNNKNVRDHEWNYKEVEVLNKYLFFTAKPVVYLVNISEADFIKKKNKWLGKIQNWINSHGGGKIIPYSVSYEQKLFNASDEQKLKIIKETGAESSLGKIITTGYHALELLHYFTGGDDEVKCWTFRKGTKAPAAAGIIHTDFERGFISADVTKFDDLLNLLKEKITKYKMETLFTSNLMFLIPKRKNKLINYYFNS
jgi:obg-like ATPase 1